MIWIWDVQKDRSNQRKHGIGFATVQLVFDDPLALSRPDPHEGEERWQTVGRVGSVVVFVVHTWPDAVDGVETGRIISARKATTHERRAYEEGDF